MDNFNELLSPNEKFFRKDISKIDFGELIEYLKNCKDKNIRKNTIIKLINFLEKNT
jgi:hypothetical protein